MRDLIILLIVFGSIPLIMKRAYVGVLVWSWLGYMNPHRLAWGFAYDFPFSQVIALVTLGSLVFDRTRRGLPIDALTITWMLFFVWTNFTTLFALDPEAAYAEWDRFSKITLFSVITIMLMQEKKRLNLLIVVIVFSLGFYGIKGGIFAFLTGSEHRVFGPTDSFFEDNNALALALIMVLPLLRYMQLQTDRRIVRLVLFGFMALMMMAIVTSHSRGALLAGAAMVAFMWFKGPNKLATGVLILIALPVLVMQMPDHWFDRMQTISTYEEDASAMGRINAWWFAFNLAVDRPFVGGGFSTFTEELFQKYAPEPEAFHDSHSIYFEVLAEHGFVGLALFLTLGALSLRRARLLAERASRLEDMRWAENLASMVQVCLVGYAVGGAFLGLAYFDLYYHLIAVLVLIGAIVTDAEKKALSTPQTPTTREKEEPDMPKAAATTAAIREEYRQ